MFRPHANLFIFSDVYHSKEQTQNALKSIAALTTGFMGGLVGAPLAQKESIARFATSSPPTANANQASPFNNH